MKESDTKFIKYEVVEISSMISTSASANRIYSYDSITGVCLAGTAEVDCSKLKKDPDLKPYLK